MELTISRSIGGQALRGRSEFNHILIYLTLSLLIGCSSGNDAPSPREEALTKLTNGIWKMQSVTVDGVNRTDLFTGFTIKFSKTAFESFDGDPVWPTNDTWSFVDDDATSLQRGDRITVNILTLTEATLQLRLVWDKTTLGPGRVGSVKGAYEFQFTK